jgi:hypothetical protein
MGSLSTVIGLSLSALYGLSLIKQCAQPIDKLPYCTGEFKVFLAEGHLGILLLIGGLAAGNLIRDIVFRAAFNALNNNVLIAHRFRVIDKEFKAMAKQLAKHTRREENQEQKNRVQQLAQGILKNMPLMKQLLRSRQDFSQEQVNTITLPLETACRRSLLTN